MYKYLFGLIALIMGCIIIVSLNKTLDMYKYLWTCILIFINACKHEFEQPSWTTQWTAPLANSSLSINQLQQDSTILGTHLKTIVYS